MYLISKVNKVPSYMNQVDLFNELNIISDVPTDPCSPTPCGSNAECNEGTCTCLPEYHGDPYFGCIPECVLNSDCPRDKACIRNKCGDPCAGTCSNEAICQVINHIPMCSCPMGTTGSPFFYCSKIMGNFLVFVT